MGGRRGSVPVLGIFKKFMFPPPNITNRNRSPRGLEFFLCVYNSLLINMHVFVVVLHFQRSESLDQELLAGNRCGLCASHDVNYRMIDRELEDGFDGKMEEKQGWGSVVETRSMDLVG
jgi:hypothetical protein